MKNVETAKIRSRKPSTIWTLALWKWNHSLANEAFFQIMMLVYNIFLLFTMDKGSASEYR